MARKHRDALVWRILARVDGPRQDADMAERRAVALVRALFGRRCLNLRDGGQGMTSRDARALWADPAYSARTGAAIREAFARPEVRESIQHAKKRKGVPVGQLISLALSGQIALDRDAEIDGYSGFRVRIRDVNALAEEMAGRAAGVDEFTETISAAVFGRSVGLRDGGNFQKLIEAGHVPARAFRNPKTHTLQWRMTPADVAAFHRKFLTTSTIEAEFGLHRNRILAVLRATGVRPFTVDGVSAGSVWLREEVQHHFLAQ